MNRLRLRFNLPANVILHSFFVPFIGRDPPKNAFAVRDIPQLDVELIVGQRMRSGRKLQNDKKLKDI